MSENCKDYSAADYGIIGTLGEVFHEPSVSHTWTLSEVLYELSVHGIIYSVRRKISVCEADIYFHLTLYRQNEGAVEDSAGCAKRSRILER